MFGEVIRGYSGIIKTKQLNLLFKNNELPVKTIIGWNEGLKMENMREVFNRVAEFLGMKNIDIANILFSLFLAIVIAFIISQIYKFTHRGLNYELTFMSSLVALAPIITIVMLYIRGDLVLSLGLVGSISIIRFRTPIKDTRDMVFLFWVIAVGLGCGTYNWNVVIISTIVISLVMFLLHFIRYGRSKATDYVLVITGSKSPKNQAISQILAQYTKEARVRSQEIEDEYWEIIYEIQFSDLTDTQVGELHEQIKKIDNVIKVSLLAPQIALPV